MPSSSFHRWTTTRAATLDEMRSVHRSVGGDSPGRRYTTQQVNRSYAVLLASQFQGFCRDLHSECVDHILGVLAPSADLRTIVRAEFTRVRQLDRGNAQPGSLGADFGRLGIDLWDTLDHANASADAWRRDIELLNEWRNAIVHQDFPAEKFGEIINLQLRQVSQWRTSCKRLARAMDVVLRQHLQTLTGQQPW